MAGAGVRLVTAYFFLAGFFAGASFFAGAAAFLAGAAFLAASFLTGAFLAGAFFTGIKNPPFHPQRRRVRKIGSAFDLSAWTNKRERFGQCFSAKVTQILII